MHPALDPARLLELIASRRSMGLSRLKPDPIDPDQVQRMLEAANWAPSNEDTEPWRFAVFTGDGREALAEMFGQAYRVDHPEKFDTEAYEGYRARAYAAPVWIAIGMQPGTDESGEPAVPEEEELLAVGGAVLNLHLMAQAQGIAGMWHSKGVSVHPEVARGLGWTAPSRLLGFFMAGYPSTEWLGSTRRPLAEKLRWLRDSGDKL